MHSWSLILHWEKALSASHYTYWASLFRYFLPPPPNPNPLRLPLSERLCLYHTYCFCAYLYVIWTLPTPYSLQETVVPICFCSVVGAVQLSWSRVGLKSRAQYSSWFESPVLPESIFSADSLTLLQDTERETSLLTTAEITWSVRKSIV